MNILEYIEECMAQGMSEDDASKCADILYNDEWDTEHDEYDEW